MAKKASTKKAATKTTAKKAAEKTTVEKIDVTEAVEKVEVKEPAKKVAKKTEAKEPAKKATAKKASKEVIIKADINGESKKASDNFKVYENENDNISQNLLWGTRNFDFSKKHTVNFLISNALYWFKEFHIDALRVDAVVNIIYLNYGEREEKNVNPYGIKFLQELNKTVYENVKNPIMIAEDSSSYPLVTKPTYLGGLGFTFKWNMGWMNDSLSYMEKDPIFRKYEHEKLTFPICYSFSENYILPISHDEVVHGKASLIGKMPGSYEEKFAGVRSFLGYMMSHPGKKLLFMGSEFGQFIEWDYKRQLDWMLLEYDAHRQLKAYVAALNAFYLKNPPLWEEDCSWNGFNWIVSDDRDNSVAAFIRRDKSGNEIISVCNFTPVTRHKYRFGVPEKGTYRVVFSSASAEFGGKGEGTVGSVRAKKKPMHGYDYSIELDLEGLSCMFIKNTSRKK